MNCSTRIPILLVSWSLLAAHSGFAQGPLTPPAPPAPVMKSLQDLWDKLGLIEAQNQSLAQAHAQPRKFSAFADPVSPSAGASACADIPIPASETIKLESVVASTYADAGATAYVKFSVKTSAGGGKIVAQRVPVVATGDDPVNDTRSGLLQLPIRLTGGPFANVAIGEVYSLSVCVDSSSTETGRGVFLVTGHYE